MEPKLEESVGESGYYLNPQETFWFVWNECNSSVFKVNSQFNSSKVGKGERRWTLIHWDILEWKFTLERIDLEERFGWIGEKFTAKNNLETGVLQPYISLVITQKKESQKGCLKKTKHDRFFEKTSISYPLIRTRAFLPYYRRFSLLFSKCKIPSFSLQTERNIFAKQDQIYTLFYNVFITRFLFNLNDEMRLLSRFNCHKIVLLLRLNMSFLQKFFLEYCSVTCVILSTVSFSTIIVVEWIASSCFSVIILLLSLLLVSVVYDFHTNSDCILVLNLMSCTSNILFRYCVLCQISNVKNFYNVSTHMK